MVIAVSGERGKRNSGFYSPRRRGQRRESATAGLPAEATRAAKRKARQRACPPKRERNEGREREGGSNSVVESQPSKLLVVGSIPVSRSSLRPPELYAKAGFGWRANLRAKAVSAIARRAKADRMASQVSWCGRLVGRSAKADVAQLAERVLGKDEVTGPIPVIGSNLRRAEA